MVRIICTRLVFNVPILFHKKLKSTTTTKSKYLSTRIKHWEETSISKWDTEEIFIGSENANAVSVRKQFQVSKLSILSVFLLHNRFLSWYHHIKVWTYFFAIKSNATHSLMMKWRNALSWGTVCRLLSQSYKKRGIHWTAWSSIFMKSDIDNQNL